MTVVETDTLDVPEPATLVLVVEPNKEPSRESTPYSNQNRVASPFGFTRPLNLIDDCAMLVAEVVSTVGEFGLRGPDVVNERIEPFVVPY